MNYLTLLIFALIVTPTRVRAAENHIHSHGKKHAHHGHGHGETHLRFRHNQAHLRSHGIGGKAHAGARSSKAFNSFDELSKPETWGGKIFTSFDGLSKPDTRGGKALTSFNGLSKPETRGGKASASIGGTPQLNAKGGNASISIGGQTQLDAKNDNASTIIGGLTQLEARNDNASTSIGGQMLDARSSIADQTQKMPDNWACRGRNTMSFLTANLSIVTGQTGGKAVLPCEIKNLCEGSVTWVRRRDFSLLTVGSSTYTSDARFKSIHSFNSNDWSLLIKFLTLKDAGIYECKVSSHPVVNIFIELRIVEAKAEIDGPVEKYVKWGSTLDINCLISDSADVPEYIFWYHSEKMINFDSDDTRNLKSDLEQRMSTISIEKADKQHSGNYSCHSNNAFPASIYVHILVEETPAAMQTGSVGKIITNIIYNIVLSLFLIFIPAFRND